MKNKNSIVFFGIVILLLGSLIYLVISHMGGIEKDYLLWQGPNGEYPIKMYNIENVTFYEIRVVVGDNAYLLPLRTGPEEVQDIPVASGLKEFVLTKGIIYTTRDPNLANQTEGYSTIAAMEFGKVLGTAQYSVYGIPVKAAYTFPTQEVLNANLPVITCADSTEYQGVIHMKLSDVNQIYFENEDCLVLEATDGQELVKVADRLTYGLLGAM